MGIRNRNKGRNPPVVESSVFPSRPCKRRKDGAPDVLNLDIKIKGSSTRQGFLGISENHPDAPDYYNNSKTDGSGDPTSRAYFRLDDNNGETPELNNAIHNGAPHESGDMKKDPDSIW